MKKRRREALRIERRRTMERNRRAKRLLGEMKALWQQGHEIVNRAKARRRMALTGIGST